MYNRSMNKLKYLSVAVNALKRLKKQNAAAEGENLMGTEPMCTVQVLHLMDFCFLQIKMKLKAKEPKDIFH